MATEKPPEPTGTAVRSDMGDSLKGKVLIAMPGMADMRFEKAVLILLEHNSDGAMGVIINKPLDAVHFDDLLDQLDIPHGDTDFEDYPVYFGGPVDIGRGFVLHSKDFMLSHSAELDPIAVTTSVDMLARIAGGNGPQESIFCIGYAGWTAGQLDEEIKENTWLHAPLDAQLLFALPFEKRWDAAMALAGVNPDFLSSEAGHA